VAPAKPERAHLSPVRDAVPSPTRLDCGTESLGGAGRRLCSGRPGGNPVFLVSGPRRRAAPGRNQANPRPSAPGPTQARRQVGVRASTVEPTWTSARPPCRERTTETLSLSRRHGQCNWPQISESVARSAGIPWTSRGSGHRSKSRDRKKSLLRRGYARLVPCSVVRKGSTVRVRQRALSERLWWRGMRRSCRSRGAA
jgi:hypothetical protein